MPISYWLSAPRILKVLLLLLVLVVAVSYILLGLTMPCVVLCAVASAAFICSFYIWRRKGPPHFRDLSFTWAFANLAILSVVVPTTVIQHGDVQADVHPSRCFVAWSPNGWFPRGTPCEVPLPIKLDRTEFEKQEVVLDRFSIWKFVAIGQTIVFGILLFWDMKVVTKFTVPLALLIVVEPLVPLTMAILRLWRWELVGTILFLALLLIQDFAIWFHGHRKNASGSMADGEHEAAYLASLIWHVDLPVLIGSLILLLITWGPFRDSTAEYAERFFAGGVAFSLIVANMTIVLLRCSMHRKGYQDAKLKGGCASFFDYCGL
jgi:hypothetical protein